MYIVVDEDNTVYKLDKLDGSIQEQVLDGLIDVIDCESLKISTGYHFEDLPNYYDNPETE